MQCLAAIHWSAALPKASSIADIGTSARKEIIEVSEVSSAFLNASADLLHVLAESQPST